MVDCPLDLNKMALDACIEAVQDGRYLSAEEVQWVLTHAANIREQLRIAKEGLGLLGRCGDRMAMELAKQTLADMNAAGEG